MKHATPQPEQCIQEYLIYGLLLSLHFYSILLFVSLLLLFCWKFFFIDTNQSWIFLQIGNRTILKDKGIKLKRKSQAPILKICEIINLKLPTTLLDIEFRNFSQI